MGVLARADPGRAMTPTTSLQTAHGIRPHTLAAGRRTAVLRRRERHDHEHAEVESFEIALALLHEAILRAERWYQRREQAFLELEQRCAETARDLRARGMVGQPTYVLVD